MLQERLVNHIAGGTVNTTEGVMTTPTAYKIRSSLEYNHGTSLQTHAMLRSPLISPRVNVTTQLKDALHYAFCNVKKDRDIHSTRAHATFNGNAVLKAATT